MMDCLVFSFSVYRNRTQLFFWSFFAVCRNMNNFLTHFIPIEGAVRLRESAVRLGLLSSLKN